MIFGKMEEIYFYAGGLGRGNRLDVLWEFRILALVIATLNGRGPPAIAAISERRNTDWTSKKTVSLFDQQPNSLERQLGLDQLREPVYVGAARLSLLPPHVKRVSDRMRTADQGRAEGQGCRAPARGGAGFAPTQFARGSKV